MTSQCAALPELEQSVEIGYTLPEGIARRPEPGSVPLRRAYSFRCRAGIAPRAALRVALHDAIQTLGQIAFDGPHIDLEPVGQQVLVKMVALMQKGKMPERQWTNFSPFEIALPAHHADALRLEIRSSLERSC